MKESDTAKGKMPPWRGMAWRQGKTYLAGELEVQRGARETEEDTGTSVGGLLSVMRREKDANVREGTVLNCSQDDTKG